MAGYICFRINDIYSYKESVEEASEDIKSSFNSINNDIDVTKNKTKICLSEIKEALDMMGWDLHELNQVYEHDEERRDLFQKKINELNEKLKKIKPLMKKAEDELKRAKQNEAG